MKYLIFSIQIAFFMLMTTQSWGLEAIEQNQLQTPGQRIIEQVAKDERISFILYQLAKALNSNSSQAWDKPYPRLNVVSLYSKEAEKFKFIQIYESFAIDLLAWIKQKYGANDQQVYRMVCSPPTGMETLLCTSNGVCYSGPDIGTYCCPF